MANTQDLQQRVAQAIAAEVGPVTGALADRATALEGDAATLSTRADAIESRATALEGRATTLETGATQTDARLVALERLSFRSVAVTLPLLSVGATQVAVLWDTQFLDASYHVSLTIEAGQVALGKLTAGVLAGSVTATGFTAVLSNAALVSIQAGSVLHVLGWRVLGGGLR